MYQKYDMSGNIFNQQKDNKTYKIIPKQFSCFNIDSKEMQLNKILNNSINDNETQIEVYNKQCYGKKCLLITFSIIMLLSVTLAIVLSIVL